ncbi:MAG: multidrug ABC transporter ATP-binding protein [Methanosphaera sp. rholeuAM130]|nr:MAG: multidrug ABC transporter ATP-binding protein [Methanosphaera sp. rholeuAM130]
MDSNEKIGIRKVFKNILSIMDGYRLKFIITGIFALLSVLFTVYSPILLGDAINVLFDGSNKLLNHTGTMDFSALTNILLLAATLYFLSATFNYLQTYLLKETTMEISFSLRKQVIDKVLSLPMDTLDNNQRGETISRLISDVDILEEALTSSFIEITRIVLVMIVSLILMLACNVWLTVIIVLLVLFTSGFKGHIINYSQQYFFKHMDSKTDTISKIEEVITNHELIRLSNYENYALDEFNENIEKWHETEWKSKFFSNLNIPLINFTSNLGYVTIAVFGAIFVLQGSMSVGRILSFIEYLKNFTEPVEKITAILPELQAGLSSYERIYNFIKLDDEENPSTKEFKEFNDEIIFDNVSFGYTADEKVIDDFSLTVKKGQKLAIIGETGSGKTTILKLLMRFYDLNSGEIKIDGVNINDYDKNSLRSFMAMVPQESWLFSDTIEENIRYGKLDSSKEEIIKVSKQLNTDFFIRQQKDGYKTRLNEDGDNLSQGQKQLLTITRAALSNKEILIMDEATSSVDTHTEKLIQNAMDGLMADKTTIVVAHRLSTIQNADIIVVLEKGRIIEQGNHEKLLARKGYYYNTLKNQKEEDN